MSAAREDTIRLDGHDVKVTRPEKILFPADGITKGDLIRYYQEIGPWMLPHLEGRPLALQRFPDGIVGPSFFQKAAASYYPAWIKKVTVQKAGGTLQQVVCNDAATLVYLANQACITLHPWLSRYDRPDHPDQMIFDLDPSTEDVAAVVQAARALKELLDLLELPAYVKSTGSRGLHVAVPLDRKQDFDSVRAFARSLAEIVVAHDPSRYTLEQYKNRREGRIFIDINRNAYAQTAVAPYSVRAKNGAPVSVPLEWSEIRKKTFRPDGMSMAAVLERMKKVEDPWKDFQGNTTSLEPARRKLRSLQAA